MSKKKKKGGRHPNSLKALEENRWKNIEEARRKSGDNPRSRQNLLLGRHAKYKKGNKDARIKYRKRSINRIIEKLEDESGRTIHELLDSEPIVIAMAWGVLISLMNSPNIDPRSRMAAASKVLEYGLGPPGQGAINGDINQTINFIQQNVNLAAKDEEENRDLVNELNTLVSRELEPASPNALPERPVARPEIRDGDPQRTEGQHGVAGGDVRES